MRTNKGIAVTILLSAMIALSACGNSEPSDSGSIPAAQPETETSTPAPSDGKADAPDTVDSDTTTTDGAETDKEAKAPAGGGSIEKPSAKDKKAGALTLEQAQLYLESPPEAVKNQKDILTELMGVTISMLSEGQQAPFNEMLELIQQDKLDEAKKIYEQLVVAYDYQKVDFDEKLNEIEGKENK
ncbi:type VI secretion system transmembrane protein TssO [Paenibacillus sp. p3-SID867]|uniref:type VI secretion system transmembrane protein TssO n=1 Tax=Paenibacillus sp. p3-SID867 TaxID=2916363 RepID=UPI0021A7B345|nr:type VI secretion system transmembrane protein TssO [Paenibacillus sp. p3-SID867]MCT1400278.1 type VI secretion system transmembrane protein TssO [Paenibacillus sp. p3-SID867]